MARDFPELPSCCNHVGLFPAPTGACVAYPLDCSLVVASTQGSSAAVGLSPTSVGVIGPRGWARSSVGPMSARLPSVAYHLRRRDSTSQAGGYVPGIDRERDRPACLDSASPQAIRCDKVRRPAKWSASKRKSASKIFGGQSGPRVCFV